jgi:hypothetical protein
VPVHHSKHSYTAAAWFVQLQARRSSSGQQQQLRVEDAGATPQQEQQQLQHRDAYQSLLECEALLSGTADGHLQVHAASGQLVFKQRLSAQPVRDILVRPHCSGGCRRCACVHPKRFSRLALAAVSQAHNCCMHTHLHARLAGLGSSEPGEEVCVCFSNALVRINSLDLRAQVSTLAEGCCSSWRQVVLVCPP